MSIDMEQFHQVFFEESFECLDAMETGLLNLDMGAVDSEEINTIFRAAHSIKGGSGTFGFDNVAAYTHVMETLLDEMRDGRRDVTQQAVEVLLGSVDCLREMLNAIEAKEPVDESRVAEHKKSLETELNSAQSTTDESESTPVVQEAVTPEPTVAASIEASVLASPVVWDIKFVPHEDLLVTGNDPVRMFRELAELGKLDVTINLEGLPDNLDGLNPEFCYLAWDLVLTADVGKDEIDDVFAWVEDECDLSIVLRDPVVVPLNNTDDTQALVLPEIVAPVQEVMAAAEEITEPEPTEESVEITDETTVIVAPKEKSAEKKKAASHTASIRVDTGKIDGLINMVGELVIIQSMLSLAGENFSTDNLDRLKLGLSQLERHTRELQESVMNIRMLPINFVFSRFPRLVHDLSLKLEKKIELKLVGENTEVDKTVIEMISDPLVHLVRNSLDHGIEIPEERLKKGKPETGSITLAAYHRGGNIVIEVKDDGKGLNKEVLRQKAIEKGLIADNAILTDKQIYHLIFMAGFSTAEKLTDVSGRGVGMDVVRRNIQELGGSVEIDSELGVGSTMSISLPLTLAILDGQSITVGDETYIIPLSAIVESMNMEEGQINHVVGKGEAFLLHGEYLPIIRLHEIFNITSVKSSNLIEGTVVVVDGLDGSRCGLFVDELLGQQQVVIKSLEKNYRSIDGISSATILGDGSVALILDIPGLIKLSNQ